MVIQDNNEHNQCLTARPELAEGLVQSPLSAYI
jgi:hypothetical protein